MLDELLSNMSEEQVASLTTDQVDSIVKRVCADRGIRIDPQPPIPVPMASSPDATLFVLENVGFISQEQANRAVEMLLGEFPELWKESYRNRYGDYRRSLERSETIQITPKQVWTEAGLARHCASLERQSRIANDTEGAKKEYEKHLGLYEQACEEVSAAISKLQRATYDKRQLDLKFAEYLEIANGDYAMAEAFIRKAYSIPEGWTPPAAKEADDGR